MSAALPDRFRKHAERAGLFAGGGRALVAVSGGADSLALMALLADTGLVEVVVGHVDHGIHPASGEWADCVGTAAAGLGLDCRLRRLALGPGTSETAARHARYAALRDLQRETGAAWVATAHHADDQVETVLLRLLRGSGPAGLAGVPARGPDGLVRPLLPFGREELAAWRRRAHPTLTPVADPANADSRHDRAWVRHALLPLLRQRHPDTSDAIRRLARQAGADRAAWSAALRALPGLEMRLDGGAAEVARAPLAGYDKTLSDAVLRAMAREVHCVLGPRGSARVARMLQTGASGQWCELGGGWVAEIVFDRLRIHRPPAAPAPGRREAVHWGDRPAGEASWAGWCIAWEAGLAGAPTRTGWTTWTTGGAGRVRGVAAGDRIRPLGGTGRRPVRRLLMEARVPRRERATWPVLEREGTIIWVPGVCRSTAALPAPGETALKLDAHRHRDP